MCALGLHTHDDAPRGLVWVVDDSHLQSEAARRALAKDHDVRVFNDGASTLEALGSGASPDLLVLDWHMPNLSGLEVCRFVRETRDPGSLPILILTATGSADLPNALTAGANDFVVKPFCPTELLARVSALVRNKSLYARLTEMERRLRVEGEFRERFMGMLAHDLRQPLNTFVLANHTIAKAVAPSPMLNKLLEMQRRAANRMNRMIAELLDFARSRPENGMPIEREWMDLEPLIGAVVEEILVAYPSRSIRLQVEGSCSGRWDRDRLAQICTNLIGNAIEHSSNPSAPIDVRVARSHEYVEIAVSNEGKAIPSDLLPVLFEPFHRVRDANRSTGSLGLGLHIVHEIVRAHGGTVTAESDDDATVFRVSLPIGDESPSFDQASRAAAASAPAGA
jgi:two-component system sensor histidine kinase/response regulator